MSSEGLTQSSLEAKTALPTARGNFASTTASASPTSMSSTAVDGNDGLDQGEQWPLFSELSSEVPEATRSSSWSSSTSVVPTGIEGESSEIPFSTSSSFPVFPENSSEGLGKGYEAMHKSYAPLTASLLWPSVTGGCGMVLGLISGFLVLRLLATKRLDLLAVSSNDGE